MAQLSTRTQELMLSAVFNSATDFAIFTIDRRRKITNWNIGAQNLLGWTAAEVTGRSGDVIFTAEDREQGAPAMEARQALAVGRAADERWQVRKDGSRFRAFGVLMPLLGDEAGQGFLKILRDKTDQWRAQEELRESEAYFRQLADYGPAFVWIADPTGSITYRSRSWHEFTNQPLDAGLGAELDALHPDDRTRARDAFLAANVARKDFHAEYRLRRGDGTYCWVLSAARPRFAENGHYLGYVGSIVDITERKLAEGLQSELFHMSRFTAMGEMASTLAHEINQPLTAIASYLKGSNRILDRMEGPQVAMLRVAVNEATEQALRAGRIIRHLREFVARGETERHIEALQKLIEEASALALVGARERGIRVDFALAHTAAFVIVDRVQIQQVLLNLLRNAVEAMQEIGPRHLTITTHDAAEKMVEIGVMDSGPGIAPEVLERLFTPFTTTKETGMGVGLSICRTIIESHGGRIWATSKPGAGAKFHFTLRTLTEEEIADAA